MAQAPRWVPHIVIEAVHLDQIREHGGLPGLRDEALLDSALARPQHKWTYKRRPDLAALAAAYLFGIVRNHPFRDGNKRVAFLVAEMFLGLNGSGIDANDADIVDLMLGAAAGELTEGAIAKWIRSHIAKPS